MHHSNGGSHDLALRYTERLVDAGVEPSVGSYDKALAETRTGLFRAGVIHRRGPWQSFEATEFATVECVNWFNIRRLLEPIGNILPAKAGARSYAQTGVQTLATDPDQMAAGKPRAVHQPQSRRGARPRQLPRRPYSSGRSGPRHGPLRTRRSDVDAERGGHHQNGCRL